MISIQELNRKNSDRTPPKTIFELEGWLIFGILIFYEMEFQAKDWLKTHKTRVSGLFYDEFLKGNLKMTSCHLQQLKLPSEAKLMAWGGQLFFI